MRVARGGQRFGLNRRVSRRGFARLSVLVVLPLLASLWLIGYSTEQGPSSYDFDIQEPRVVADGFHFIAWERD